MLAERPIDVSSATGTGEPQTKASWRVSDLTAELTELRSRGVELEENDEPGQTVDGIADVGFALAAWLVDPHGNSLGLLQFKGRGGALTGARGASGSVSKPPDRGDGPVTTTVTRRVKPGHEVFYEQFLEGIIAAASGFPGHLGVEVFRPESAAAGEYRIVYRSTPPSTCLSGSTPTSTRPGWSAPSHTRSALRAPAW